MENKNTILTGAIITPEIIEVIRELQGGYPDVISNPLFLNEELQNDLRRIGDNIETLIDLRIKLSVENFDKVLSIVDTLNNYRNLLKSLEAPLEMFEDVNYNEFNSN